LELLLASASPRRKELLGQLGIRFGQQSVDIDETPYAQESARHYVMRMAEEKALAAWEQWGRPGLAVLASDTTVVIDEHILGKPEDFQDFQSMMQKLSGREHQVLTSVIVRTGEEIKSALCETRVFFCGLKNSDIEWYWNTGEPQDKAGGYGIQGLGARFIRKIDGSYTAVVGLPLFETAEILLNFGILSNNNA
jgi:septum formation protein